VSLCAVCFIGNTQKYDTHFAAVLLSITEQQLTDTPCEHLLWLHWMAV